MKFTYILTFVFITSCLIVSPVFSEEKEADPEPITKTEEVVDNTPTEPDKTPPKPPLNTQDRTEWVLSLLSTDKPIPTSFLLENLTSMTEKEVMDILGYQKKMGGIMEEPRDHWLRLE